MSETKEDVKTAAPSKADEAKAAKEREAAEKKAKEQNEADIETFFSFHRGDMLVRDERGCLDMNVAWKTYEASKAEDEEDKDDKS